MNKLCRHFFNNACKPKGFLGTCILKFMNGYGHKYLFEWALKFIGIKNSDSILDVGCGGGGNVSRLLKIYPNSIVYGVDYSHASVTLSRKLNIKEINSHRCQIFEGNVQSLPFDSVSFNIVTAFETVYYWPNIENSFSEIHRILKHDGIFAIVNGADAEGGWTWDKYIEGMHTYAISELKDHLQNVGFKEIKSFKEPEYHFICVIAHK